MTEMMMITVVVKKVGEQKGLSSGCGGVQFCILHNAIGKVLRYSFSMSMASSRLHLLLAQAASARHFAILYSASQSVEVVLNTQLADSEST